MTTFGIRAYGRWKQGDLASPESASSATGKREPMETGTSQRASP